MFLVFAAKVVLATETGLERNLFDWHIHGSQHLVCFFQPINTYQFDRCQIGHRFQPAWHYT